MTEEQDRSEVGDLRLIVDILHTHDAWAQIRMLEYLLDRAEQLNEQGLPGGSQSDKRKKRKAQQTEIEA